MAPMSNLHWGDLDDTDADDVDLFPPVVEGPDENGVKRVIEFKLDDNGNKVKVTTTTRVCKVSKNAAERRSWTKFGSAGDDKPGSGTTLVSTEEVFLERPRAPGELQQNAGLQIGINYGQIANNLPSPHRVVSLLQSLNVSRVKLYDADQNVLSAFLNTEVNFIVGIGNEHVSNMTDSSKALAWLQQHVQPYLPSTRIICITVGNEVYSGNDTDLKSNLLPAMQSIYQALVELGLDKHVNVTTAHSFDILGNSFPPSLGSFRQDLAEYIQPLLSFHSMIKTPFLINTYPYFAYKSSPSTVPLEYVLFQPNSGVMDPNTNLNYDNMLYAQIDSVYAAIQAMGHTDIDVRISETGWPSKGDADEPGANPMNAAIYNGNLLQRIAANQGTPLKPAVPIDIYVFALFNEDLKPGPTSERNYGLFYPDGRPVYNIGLQGYLPPMLSSSSSELMVMTMFGFFLMVIAALL